MGLADVSKWIAGEWAVIAHTPITFFASILVVTFLIWRIIQWQFGARLENLQSLLSLREAQVNDYKEKLSGATPDEAKARLAALEARIDEIQPQITALRPKRVDAAQRRTMAPILDRFRGSVVQITSDATSVDGTWMAKDLTSAFNGSSWLVNSGIAMGIGDGPPSGIGVLVVNPDNLTEPQRAVVEAFQAAGLTYDLQPWRGFKVSMSSAALEILLTNRYGD